MKKRNTVTAIIILFICVAVYLNNFVFKTVVVLVVAENERVRNVSVKTAAGDSWSAKSIEDVLSLIETGIVADRVEAVVLRAEDFERCGFGRPAYTISFELNDGVSSLRRMLIGAATSEGGRYATIGGIDAVFVLPSSVVSVLTKPIEASMEENR